MKRWVCISLAVASMFAMAVIAVAGDEKKADAHGDPAAMAAWMAAATPGEHHEHLKKLAGNFDYTMKSWMDPSAPPMETTGKRTAHLLLGGRYLEEKITGDFMGTTFEGIGTLGYDNVGKQYVGTWIDNMSTGIMASHGTCGKDGWEMTGESLDPQTGKLVKSRHKLTMPDENTLFMEMWMPGPDGKEYKWMEMTCKRTS
ncbi:MAG TPA: DUF1579 domain-containing protein [Candidatus Krumholzibacteria bacterium]|nr:DUF1579 domain-containing protein [Candidatus Krumholzibacteria bacterium]